jgi:hypothetical protein
MNYWRCRRFREKTDSVHEWLQKVERTQRLLMGMRDCTTAPSVSCSIPRLQQGDTLVASIDEEIRKTDGQSKSKETRQRVDNSPEQPKLRQ